MTGGDVRLLHVPATHLGNLPDILAHLGAELEIRGDGEEIRIRMRRRPAAIPYLATAPYPGFPTDLQSVLMAVLSVSSGLSLLEEKIFEARFQTVPELRRMGASIQQGEAFALIEGKERLLGTDVRAEELRGGAALIMAAVAAEGKSRISGMEYVHRGYEDIQGDLKKLGVVVNYS